MPAYQKTKSSLLSKNYLKLTVFLLLLVFLAILSLRPIELDDVWWHLSAGRFIIENGQIPHTDPFSFANEKTPWVLTQWLGSVTLYSIYAVAGPWGLKIFRVVFFLITLAVFFFYARKKLPLSFLLILIFTLALGLGTRCLLRPLLFNFLLIQLFLIILFHYHRCHNRRWLFFLPPLSILWANLHLGNFMYGAPILLAFWISYGVNYAQQKWGGKANDQQRAAAVNRFKDLSLILFLHLAGTFVSPYGLENALHPFKIIFIPNYANFSVIGLQYIKEVQPPAYIFTAYGWWFAILFLGAVFSFIRDQGRDLTRALLFVFSLFMFLYGNRAVDFFSLSAAYIIAEGSRNISLNKTWGTYKFSKRADILMMLFLALILSTMTIREFNTKVFLYGRAQRLRFLVEGYDSPSKVVQLLKDSKTAGRIFASDHYGGYLIWNGYPLLKPFVDGRQLNQTAFFTYLQVRDDPEKLWAAAEKEFQFNMALIDTGLSINDKLVAHFADLPTWQLAFVDGESILFVKKGALVLPAGLEEFEQQSKSVEVPLQKAKAVFQQPPLAKNSLRQLFYPPLRYSSLQAEGATLFDLGYQGAGVSRLLKDFEANHSEGTKILLYTILINRIEKK